MMVKAEIEINSSREAVWRTITDIDNAGDVISSIIKINVLERPSAGLVGLEWEETRMMFGRESTETMWITDSVENEHYGTRAQSHGSVYITRLSLGTGNGSTLLTMAFTAEARSAGAKVMSFLMGPFIRGSLKKAMMKDLTDIKAHVESGQ